MAYEYQPAQSLQQYRKPQPNNYPTPPRSSSPKDYDHFPPTDLATSVETQSVVAQPSYSRSNLEAYQNGHYSQQQQQQYSDNLPQPAYYNELTQYHAAKGQHLTTTPKKSSYDEIPQHHVKQPYSPRHLNHNIHAFATENNHHSSAQPRKPTSRRHSPPRPHSPLHRSQTPLTPYNTSRARPRPGLLKRVSARCKTLLKWILSLAKRHPILCSLVAFLPAVANAVGVKVARKIRSIFDGGKGLGVVREVFGDFKGLAGARSELHGVLKVVHMYANHWCRVSPSPWPRTLSMLLEVYFMEHKKF